MSPNPPFVRYPEVIHAYHVGRYIDPGNDLVMHEQHVLYRVEENTRWDFHPGPSGGLVFSSPLPDDAAFHLLPVNDAILAEVNSQRLATAQITAEAATLTTALTQFEMALQQTKTNLQQTAALRATVGDLQKRLALLESTQISTPVTSTTNDTTDALSP
jgi:hypothetical protein